MTFAICICHFFWLFLFFSIWGFFWWSFYTFFDSCPLWTIVRHQTENALVYPMKQIVCFEFLLGGKTPLPDKSIMQCSFLDHIFEYDILSRSQCLTIWNSLRRNVPIRNLFPNGKKFWSLSCKQYFESFLDFDTTAFYFHQQENSDVVYSKLRKPRSLTVVRDERLCLKSPLSELFSQSEWI